MGWTLVAIGVYLSNVFLWMGDPLKHTNLPDIDGALMGLMGLGPAAYVVKKAVTTDLPHANAASLRPLAAVGAPRTLVITGTSFGRDQGQSRVTLDGTPVDATGAPWTDTEISIPLPAAHPDGRPWPAAGAAPRVVGVGVLVGGQESNRLPVAVAL